MTMIIAANLGDCILIAADKRSMVCNTETGALRLYSDQKQKIKLWRLGAVAGETIFLERVAQYFMSYQQGNLKQIDAIYEELERRVVESVPLESLNHNSLFNGVKTTLYSIPTEPFFHILQENGVICWNLK